MQTNMNPSPKHNKETTHKTMCERKFALHKNHKTNNVCFEFQVTKNELKTFGPS